jgi:hypothetical protein
LGLAIAAVLIAAISQLPAAKAVSGRQNQVADGSFISATPDGRLFTHTLSTGEPAPSARDALVGIINDDDGFMADANATVPPGFVFESDDVVYEVLTASGSELRSMIACENDANYTNSGVHFPGGKPQIFVRTPISVAGDGIFDLRIDTVLGPDANLNIDTDVPDLIGTIIAELETLGFTVSVSGADFRITKAGDVFRSVRVESTDSSITHTCARMRDQGASFPAMSQYGVVLLVAGLLLAGIVMIRRKMATAG